MRKISFSFVAILAFMLYATVAFAAAPTTAPTSVTVTPVDLTHAVVTFSAPVGADHVTYSVNGSPEANLITGDTITFTNVEGTDKLVLSLTGYGSADSSEPGPVATVGFYTHNLDMSKVASPTEGPKNANLTGVGVYSKAQAGHRVHGDYKNNTNSCASCHQTHTGSGPTLLFKSSVYDTCVACHNGTLGYYNVFSTDMNQNMGGGTFGGTHAGNMSVHLADGNVEIGAAPGSISSTATGAAWGKEFDCASCHDPHGSYSSRLLATNPNNMAEVERVTNSTEQWFYGNKIKDLTVDNGTDIAGRNTLVAGWSKTVNPYDGPTAMFKAVKFQLGAADVAPGAEYADLGLNAGDYVVQIYQLDNTLASGAAWVKASYVQNGGSSADHIDLTTVAGKDLNKDTANYSTAVAGFWRGALQYGKVGTNTGWQVNGARGYVAFGSAVALTKNGVTYASLADIYADIAKVTVGTIQKTVLPMQNPIVNGVSTPMTMPNGVAIEMTKLTGIVNANPANGYNYFCAGCHSAYLSGGGEHYYDANGDGIRENEGATPTIGATTFKHHAIDKNYTCARCHYAHGTDANWMLDAAGNTVSELVGQANPAGGTYTLATAQAYMVDANASSALKRYTNMAVCYGCHTSSHSAVIVSSGKYAVDGTQVNGLSVDGTTSYFKNSKNVDGVVSGTGKNF